MKVDLGGRISPCAISFKYELRNIVVVCMSRVCSLPNEKNSEKHKSPKRLFVAFEDPPGYIYLCLSAEEQQKVTVRLTFKQDPVKKKEIVLDKSTLPKLSDLKAPPLPDETLV